MQALEDLEHEQFRRKQEEVRQVAADAHKPSDLETWDQWFARYLPTMECGESHRRITGKVAGKWISPVIGPKPVRSLTVRARELSMKRVRDVLVRALEARDRGASSADDAELIGCVLARFGMTARVESIRVAVESLKKRDPLGLADWVTLHRGPARATIALLDRLQLRGSYLDRLASVRREVEDGDDAELVRRARGILVRPVDLVLYAVAAIGLSPATASRLLSIADRRGRARRLTKKR